jgi:hypothetical protein
MDLFEIFRAVVMEDIYEIPAEEQHQDYVLSLYERINRYDAQSSKQRIEAEVLQSQQSFEKQYLINISPSKNSHPELNFGERQIAKFEFTETAYRTFKVPIPKREYVVERHQILDQHKVLMKEFKR